MYYTQCTIYDRKGSLLVQRTLTIGGRDRQKIRHHDYSNYSVPTRGDNPSLGFKTNESREKIWLFF